MISIQDVEKLASLSRLSLTEDEKVKFQGEIDTILGYVANINTLASSAPEIGHLKVNALRDDVVSHSSREFSENLLENSPEREGNFVKVKKILE